MADNDNHVIKSFRKFQKKLEKFTNDNDDKVFYFRGEHNNYPYSIPSIYRNGKSKIAKKSDQFYSDLSVHLGDLSLFNLPYSNQLARFQHYQAPTRLLDITSNPLVALFFALENTKTNKHKNRNIYFYAVDKSEIKYQDGHTVNMEVTANWMNQEIVHKFLEKMKNMSKRPDNYEKYIEESNHSKDISNFMIELNLKDKLIEKMNNPKKIFEDLDRAYFVNFIRESDRMKTQQGAFIMPKYLTGMDSTNEDFSTEQKKQVHDSIINSRNIKFKHYEISSDHVEEIRKDINSLGVNAGFVYPDIEHYSQFLIDSYNER